LLAANINGTITATKLFQFIVAFVYNVAQI